MSDLDKACRDAVQRHRSRRLGLYLEAILADTIQPPGGDETRSVLPGWDAHLKEFDASE